MKKVIFVIFLICLTCLSGCTDAKTANEVLTKQGYTNIKITGYNFFTCGQDDFYSTGFTAKTITGATISGTVCSGFLFKGATVRF